MDRFDLSEYIYVFNDEIWCDRLEMVDYDVFNEDWMVLNDAKSA
jgi:hypothetical protein